MQSSKNRKYIFASNAQTTQPLAGASFDNSSKLSNGAMKVLNSFKDDRSIIFDGTLLSSGAIGFITESTLKHKEHKPSYQVYRDQLNNSSY